ncbi:hypothetical protein BDB01DRAFT_836124 [Pilobolus umbonatus]|nr:hypothetical protein BDB01DRAFT_836124 [Pilobolus umbonatus]
MWCLYVEHVDFDNMVAFFNTKRKGLKFLSNHHLNVVDPSQKEIVISITRDEAYAKCLFYRYMTRETYADGKLTLIMKKIEMNKQLFRVFSQEDDPSFRERERLAEEEQKRLTVKLSTGRVFAMDVVFSPSFIASLNLDFSSFQT